MQPEDATRRIITVDGRDYRFHRDCGEFVWLAALDAGIGGPFYWVRASEIAHNAQPSREDRATRIKATQLRLAALPKNGPEYMDALGEMARAMREGQS